MQLCWLVSLHDMSNCPVCDQEHFVNDQTEFVGGNPHENTAVYRNFCINGHTSYYSEETQEQTLDDPT